MKIKYRFIIHWIVNNIDYTDQLSNIWPTFVARLVLVMAPNSKAVIENYVEGHGL